jgi:hypothetical protein
MHRVGGDRCDRERRKAGILSELRANGEAVHDRQFDIQENRTGLSLVVDVERLPPMPGLQHLPARALQNCARQVPALRVDVDNGHLAQHILIA